MGGKGCTVLEGGKGGTILLLELFACPGDESSTWIEVGLEFGLNCPE